MDGLTPSVFIVFGITGDLARRKVLPAMYHLFKNSMLPEPTFIVGTSRRQISPEEMRQEFTKSLETFEPGYDPAVLDKMLSVSSMAKVDPSVDEDYQQLKAYLDQLESQANVCLQQLFYLSIPPQIFGEVVERLGANGLNQGCQHGMTASRLLVEKPFGYDLASAQDLINKVAAHFQEEQVFRIDHYLAKETAQNILTFRTYNPLFRHIWNRRHITGITVTAIEKIGIEGRANFYESVGALRDLIQSHLIQLLALTVLDTPKELNSASVHANKLAMLEALEPVPTDQLDQRAVRGQYASYRQEVGKPDTAVETFAALKLFSSDERWQEIPFKLITGKSMNERRTEITIDFGHQDINRLQLRILPDEGITMTLQVKKPDFSNHVEPVTMNFTYDGAFGGNHRPDAYERVIVEAIRGDHILFATAEEVLASWRILEPVIEAWRRDGQDLIIYPNESDLTFLENRL